jgi:predicted ATP-grasp superfamily ATP-dependent carboligase
MVVVSDRPRSLAGASKWAAEDIVLPGPLSDPEGFAHGLATLTQRLEPALLLPVSEASLYAAMRAADRLDVKIPWPSLSSISAINDKEAVLATAREIGIATPEQQVASDEGQLLAAASQIGFPVVLKPSRSIRQSGSRSVKLSVAHAGSSGQLRQIASTLPGSAYPLLVQRKINGPGVGIFLLLWEGQVVGLFSHRRLREKPPSGGVSVYRESVAADPALVSLSLELLKRFNWQGVAMVEYKIDETTGRPYLMEINGRFWGSLQLAIDAGVDFPALLVDCALGRTPQPVTDYRLGVRSRWWWGDVDQLILHLTRSREDLALPPKASGKVSALLQFLRVWWPGDRNEVLRLNDPRPFIHESLNWFAALRGRR